MLTQIFIALKKYEKLLRDATFNEHSLVAMMVNIAWSWAELSLFSGIFIILDQSNVKEAD